MADAPHIQRDRRDEMLSVMILTSVLQSDRTYDARRLWHDLLPERETCGLHRIDQLMRQQALRARPRRRRVLANAASLSSGVVSPNMPNQQFDASKLVGSRPPNVQYLAADGLAGV